MTLRGTLPGYVTRLRRALKKAENKFLLVMATINEAYTSKVSKKIIIKKQKSKKEN
jgi:hypothetical protein